MPTPPTRKRTRPSTPSGRLALTLIPPSLRKGGAMPVNLALTYRLGN